MTCNNGAGLNEAIAAGYPVLEAKRPSKLLKELCEKLGDEYHLASIDGGNVVHRVIGSGWDVEIFPMRSGCRKYRIVLWKGYGRQSVVQEAGVRSECVGPMVEMLLHLYVPPAVYPTRYDMGPRPSLGEEEQESQNSVGDGAGCAGPGAV